MLFEPYVCFHIFSEVRVTKWPPIGEWLLTAETFCFSLSNWQPLCQSMVQAVSFVYSSITTLVLLV